MIFLMGESFRESPKGKGMTKIRGPRHRSQGEGCFPKRRSPRALHGIKPPQKTAVGMGGRGQASPLYPWVQVGPGTYGLYGQSKAFHHSWGLQGVMNLTYLDCEVQGGKHSYAFSLTMEGILHWVRYLPELRSRHPDPCSSKREYWQIQLPSKYTRKFLPGLFISRPGKEFLGVEKADISSSGWRQVEDKGDFFIVIFYKHHKYSGTSSFYHP